MAHWAYIIYIWQIHDGSSPHFDFKVCFLTWAHSKAPSPARLQKISSAVWIEHHHHNHNRGHRHHDHNHQFFTIMIMAIMIMIMSSHRSSSIPSPASRPKHSQNRLCGTCRSFSNTEVLYPRLHILPLASWFEPTHLNMLRMPGKLSGFLEISVITIVVGTKARRKQRVTSSSFHDQC